MTSPVIILSKDITPELLYDIPRRAYDFNRGDRRFHDQIEAIEHANAEALKTGVRQVVRVTAPALLGGDEPLYLVQAVGS